MRQLFQGARDIGVAVGGPARTRGCRPCTQGGTLASTPVPTGCTQALYHHSMSFIVVTYLRESRAGMLRYVEEQFQCSVDRFLLRLSVTVSRTRNVRYCAVSSQPRTTDHVFGLL